MTLDESPGSCTTPQRRRPAGLKSPRINTYYRCTTMVIQDTDSSTHRYGFEIGTTLGKRKEVSDTAFNRSQHYITGSHSACVSRWMTVVQSGADEISVKKGEELVLDVLLSNADKVELLAKRSTGPKEVWTRGHGVRRDRMAIRDGNLIIHQFTATDAGTYEVLDSEGEILIMVTVKESVDQVTYIYEDKTHDTQQQTPALPAVKDWIVPVGLPVLLLALILGAVKRKRMHR